MKMSDTMRAARLHGISVVDLGSGLSSVIAGSRGSDQPMIRA